MKVAIIGSRSLVDVNLDDYLDIQGITEIISGGAKGIDTLVKNFANKHKIKLTEFLPNYKRYGRNAPLIRNKEIIKHADKVIAFWDGVSKGTEFTISQAKKQGKMTKVVYVNL